MSACPSCRRDVADGFAFCPHCGAPLAATSGPTEERKLVTLLFADVTGSTALADELDAEEVRELMAAYFELAREEIEARGGTVEKFVGDAVMAVFGVPVTHEDDPQRALRSALAIHERLGELNTTLRNEGRTALQVRIGINSGDVVSTTSPRPGDVMVTGDAVNVAARLQQLAAPGQILVGPRTVGAATGFEFRRLGPQGVRGKASDVEVNELIGRRSSGADPNAALLHAPLIGRDEELALLTSIYDRVAADGRPHLVTLYGQPGVGKSRLTFEFLASLAARESPPRVVRGRCLSYGTGVTFWPLAEILKGQAEILDSDSPMDASRKLTDLGRRLISTEMAPDPSRATALLGFTVGIAVPGYDFDTSDPEPLRAELVEAWRIFFSALAAGGGPVIAVIEDIHWAETALLDILDDLGARVQGPVLFVCPARPDLTDRRPGWGGGRRSFSGVFLDPLDADAASRLLAQLLAVEQLPPELHARIVDRAGGNPFFVEEILRHLIDQGRLKRVGDGWRAEPGLTAVAIPDTVQAVLAARIDLLEPDQKRALQAAAVVGRVFWPAPIGRYLEASSSRTTELLRGLESRDLVLPRLGSTMAGEPEHIFKHALVRDVAYESIPKRDRALAHLEVAHWIEETVGDRRLEVVELLAHHYTAAQRASAWGRVEPDRREEIRARAVDLLFEAAEEAGRLFAFDRARERLGTGLELANGPIERARGLEAQARLELWEDDGDAAWRLAREAIDLRVAAEGGSGDRRAISRLCGFLLGIPTRWPGLMVKLPARDEAQPYLDLGFSMLDEGDSAERLGLLMARGGWGWGFGETDTDPVRTSEYTAAAREGIELARRLGRPALVSAALDVGGASVSHGGYGAARPFQEERLLLVPELDDPAEVADIYGTMAWQLVHIGHYRRVIEMPHTYFGRSGAVTLSSVSNRMKYAFHTVACYRLALWDRFWEIFAELEAIADPDRPIQYHMLRMYGLAAYLREIEGNADGADDLIARVDRSQAPRGSVGVSGARPWIVQILVRRGRFDDARARLAQPDPVRDAQNLDLTLEARADLIAAEGAWDEAPGVVVEAREWASSTGLLALPAFADRLEGQAAMATGELEGGFALLERARDTQRDLEATWDGAQTELVMAEALAAAGRPAESAERARSALAVFSTLPAPIETGRARTLAEAGNADRA